MDRFDEMLGQAESARDTEDAGTAASMALEMSLLGIDVGMEAAVLELGRVEVLASATQKIMDSQGMAKTPAEKEARQSGPYIEHVKRIQRLGEVSERANAYARYFDTRARLLAREKEVAGV